MICIAIYRHTRRVKIFALPYCNCPADGAYCIRSLILQPRLWNQGLEKKMSKINFPNPILGRSAFSTEHPASSYGIPVLLDSAGNAYGPADLIGCNERLEFIEPDVKTAGDLVRKYAIVEYGFMEPRSDYEARLAAAKKFLND